MTDISVFAAQLFVTAQLVLGQDPIDLPRVMAVDPAALQHRVCPGRPARSCQIKAWYSPEGTIYVDQSLDLSQDLFAQSILIHEFTHHVQRMTTGHAADGCVEWRRREHEAYAVQILWLTKAGWNQGSLRG